MMMICKEFGFSYGTTIPLDYIGKTSRVFFLKTIICSDTEKNISYCNFIEKELFV